MSDLSTRGIARQRRRMTADLGDVATPPAVLLRDTDEDRERLAQIIHDRRSLDHTTDCAGRCLQSADAILAALRGQR